MKITCRLAKIIKGKGVECSDCPFERCIYDISDDMMKELVRVIEETLIESIHS